LNLIKDELSKIRYTYDTDVFQEINSETQAYWLGFISADGCIVNKGNGAYRLKITLKESDFEHLIKFNKFLKGDLQLKYKTVYLNSQPYKTVEIVINSSQICKDLINLNITSNKTYTLELPNINQDLIPHFLRGFTDGDGCLYLSDKNDQRLRYSIELVGASLKLFEQVQSYLNNQNINSKIYEKRKGNWKLMICERKSIVKFIQLIYLHNNIALDRKNTIANKLYSTLAV
jgi:intein-encoded DNA endonuclease-like protein